MKKFFHAILVLSISLMLTACGKQNVNLQTEDPEQITESEPNIEDYDNINYENTEYENPDNENKEVWPWSWEEEGEEILRRFMQVDLSTVKKEVPFSSIDWDTVVCLSALPDGITLYGYNDEEFCGRGVAIQIGDDVNYFDWTYLGTRFALPDVYWNDTDKQLYVSILKYTGSSLSAYELHVLQQYETGTLSDYVLDFDDYFSLLEEQLGFIYDSEQQILELYDQKTEQLLAQVDVSWLEEEKVENVVSGEISSFRLGEEIWLEFQPGYTVEGRGVPQYEGMPTLEVPVRLVSLENGTFELGEIKLSQYNEILQNEIYMNALKILEENYILPDGELAYGVTDIGEVEPWSNSVALCDVDLDGAEEFILLVGGTCMADVGLYVYQYDNAAQSFHKEVGLWPSTTFYTNGIVEMGLSHNHGYSGNVNFWPYYLYHYDAVADTFQKIVEVDAWEKEFYPETSLGSFPDDVDTDGDGLVYMFYEGEENEPQIVDGTDYEVWRNEQIGDAKEIEIIFIYVTDLMNK